MFSTARLKLAKQLADILLEYKFGDFEQQINTKWELFK